MRTAWEQIRMMGMLIVWGLGLIWGVICLVGLFVFIYGVRNKKRVVVWLGAAPFILTGLGVLWILRYNVATTGVKARSLMNLPPEARIIDVSIDDWDGGGIVSFRLPPTKSASEWIVTVWQMNQRRMAENERGSDPVIQKMPLDWKCVYDDGEGSFELSYNVKSHTYFYQDIEPA